MLNDIFYVSFLVESSFDTICNLKKEKNIFDAKK